MLLTRSIAVLFTAAALAGCAASNGSSGSSTGTSGGSTTTGTTGTTNGGATATSTGGSGALTSGPLTVSSPAPGAFLSGAAATTLSGTSGTSVASVKVNGAAATVANGGWTLGATLAFGINTFQARAYDASGTEVAHLAWSVLYSPTYLDATQLVTNAGELRLSQDAINKITPAVVSLMTAGGSIQATVLAAAQSLGGGTFTINSLSFGNPTITPTLVQGGVEVVIDVPNLDIDVDIPVFGSTQVTSTDAHFDATLDLTVVGGAIVATMPNAPLVTLNGFSSNNVIVSALGAIAVSPLLASAIQGALPAAVTAALATASQPISRTFMGYTATAQLAPQSLAIVPPNFIAAGDANLTITPPAGTTFTANPAANAPGSPSRAGAGSAAPDFSQTTHDVSLALREDMINRVLFAAWACRGGGVRIDQAWLAAQGVNLPFQLDASVLVPFFPGLAALNPSGGPMPLAFVVEADLPPVVVLTGSPSLVTFETGELRVGVQVDLGQGYVDLMTLSMSSQIGASISIANNQAQLSLGQPVSVTVDLLANPLGIALPDIDQFVQSLLPVALTYAGGLIPPVPLPALPAGLTLTNVDLSVGGAGADFLVIDGDL